MERAATLLRQLAAGGTQFNRQTTLNVTAATSLDKYQPGDNDVVICAALRTPIGRAKKGGFKLTPADDLLSTGTLVN
jgi:hypothetical protein